MKCLVTGGAGFIGSHLVDLLIKEGHKVVVIDDLSSGKIENINKKAKFYQKDISFDLRSFLHCFADVDCVFHLAAWPRVPKSVHDPIGTNRVNIGGTVNVLQACRQLGIKRLVYSSSSAVYGLQNASQMVETMIPEPLSPYGLQKLVGEMYCKMFAKLFGLQIISLRYFNVYGSRQLAGDEDSLVIGKFLDQKKKKRAMTIYGDGKQTRAYTHVSDVVRANYLSAMYKEEGKKGFHKVFNVGTTEETSVNDIAKMIGGKVTNIIPNPRGEFEVKRSSANFDKIKSVLKWEPKVSIKEGMIELINEKN